MKKMRKTQIIIMSIIITVLFIVSLLETPKYIIEYDGGKTLNRSEVIEMNILMGLLDEKALDNTKYIVIINNNGDEILKDSDTIITVSFDEVREDMEIMIDSIYISFKTKFKYLEKEYTSKNINLEEFRNLYHKLSDNTKNELERTMSDDYIWFENERTDKYYYFEGLKEIE